MEETEQLAFLLHARPYREHQQLVSFITEHDGKVAAVVYVGKTNRSNKKALLQPLTPLKILLHGQGSLKKLKQIESAGKSLPLKGHYLYSAFYLNELLVRLLAEQISCDLLFYQYQQSLQALLAQQPLEHTLRAFEWTLLEELGLSFDFTPAFSAISTEPNACFYFMPEQGFIPVVEKLPQPYFQAQHLVAIAEQNLTSAEVLHCYKILMRQVINQLLGNKPLNSRKLFSTASHVKQKIV